jgi:hypothetical protein
LNQWRTNGSTFDIAKMQETQAKSPGFAGIRQPRQQIGDHLVLAFSFGP